MTEGPGRRLLLLRHAKAMAAGPGPSEAFDHARSLSERGRADAAAVGALLRTRALLPDLVLVSTSRRTRETFELLRLEGPPPVRCVLSDGLYLASSQSLLDCLREQAGDAGSVMLIGHNPGLHELALELAAASPVLAPGFATCALAVFDVTGAWSALAPSQASLRDVLRP